MAPSTLSCPRCHRENHRRDALQWGSRFRCECGALLDTGFPTEVDAGDATSGPPPWLPVLPPKPRQRIEFPVRPVRVQLFLARCEQCHATLALDRNVGQALLRCGECGASRHVASGWPVLVPLNDVGGAHADYDQRPLDAPRFSVPLRERPTRAWLEHPDGSLTLLLRDTPQVVRIDGCWFVTGGGARAPLSSGDRLLPYDPASPRFGQSGAFEPPAHYEPLDERPTDRDAWLVWADHLEELHSPLTRWLRATRRTNIALSDQLGYLAPLIRRRLATVSWNAFGFCDSLRLHAATFTAYPFALDAELVPAMRYASELAIDAPDAAALDALATTLLTATLPRSLRRLVVRGPPEAARRLATALESVRQRCPWFGA